MKKQFAVIGLGRFGGNLVEEFSRLGVEVLAIDKNEERVEKYSKFATFTAQINGIDEHALVQLGIRNIDHVIVSFGGNIEESVLTTLLLKELGVKEVWVKATNVYHQKVLEKIGADRVIHPERDMAIKIANKVTSEKIIDYIELSKEHSIVEIIATSKLNHKTIMQLDVRAKYGCIIIGIQRRKNLIVAPGVDEMVLEGDMLIVMGRNEHIHRFEEDGV
ncbi:potassium channel family protein [Lederbergia citrea]|uniref:potassium channel family protein n=1 Tax=Lederbergia citrea TaxID=2833581 RepID=UPI001BC8FE01|nr:TrkA family potassium uptake protein [Lederbergia citrea]